MEHVVTPPSSPLLDSPYAERVAFHIYVVSNHEAFAPAGAEDLELDALQRQLLRLRQPQQHFSFTTHTLSMADEPRLAMAYATSLRHTAHPSLGLDGAMHTQQRAFLDSAALQLALRDAAPREAGRAYRGPQTSRTLPIFIFSSDAALPLLIDRHFQARPHTATRGHT